MSDANNPPDRLTAEEGKPFYDEAALLKVKVFIDDKERKADVVEYCISGGWARVYVGNGKGGFKKNLYGTAFQIKRIVNVNVRVEWK